MPSQQTLQFATVAVLFAVLWTLPPATQCARILAIESIGGKSHWYFMSAVLRALVDTGRHEVTVFTPFRDGDRDNYTEVDLSGAFPLLLDSDLETTVEFWSRFSWNIVPFLDMGRTLCDVVYENGKMKQILRRSNGAGDDHSSEFDLVVVEPFLLECWSYAATKLRLPLIYVSPIPELGLMERHYTGHLSNPAVVSGVLASHGVPRTFVHRLTNAVQLVYGAVQMEMHKLLVRYRGGVAGTREYDLVPPVTPSLVFVNDHFVINAPKPVPAEVVGVGGIHMKAPKKLPKDVLEFIEQSPHGVIYFTFGSTIKMSTVPDHIINAFKEALSQFPQRVIWKYEEKMEDKPENVMIKKWFPQRDILLHPNVKLFVSHGGISGLFEAIDAGVPVLGFPLLGDQPRNIDSLVNAGMAISMDLLSVSKDTFSKNVLELLKNKKYSKNAKKASKIIKDRPMSPEELVVYWTEYVLRHNGAPHLKSHALNLTWYQYYMLDVIAFVLVFICVVFYVTYSILKLICNYYLHFCNRSKVKSE